MDLLNSNTYINHVYCVTLNNILLGYKSPDIKIVM